MVLVLVGGGGVAKNAKVGEGNHARKLLLAPLATGKGRVGGGCGRRRRRGGDGDGQARVFESLIIWSDNFTN